MNTPTAEDLLARLTPIGLEEMGAIRLMDRTDTKFVAPASLLPALVEAMAEGFRVQEVDGIRVAEYATQYLDTPDLQMFLMHQNGKLNRQKVRLRSYCDSDASFLEVKRKSNRGRTTKRRVPVEVSRLDSMEELESERQFLEETTGFGLGALVPSLATGFRRITFVNWRESERITVDVNLRFENCRTGRTKALEELMIIELKRDGGQRSEFREILKGLRIKKTSFSKYCMGVVLTDPWVKQNRFKMKLTMINKLIR
jgi:hypothetical protein